MAKKWDFKNFNEKLRDLGVILRFKKWGGKKNINKSQ